MSKIRATFALFALTFFPLAAAPALAQEDGSFLEGLLERNLSGAGRDVQITGFAGALSSTATIARMTIADDAGVWLTLEDVTLDWNRAALLRGRLIVDRLTAASIALPRLPEGGEADPALPSPEAPGFRLPELPVSVQIGEISSPSIAIGAPVFGIASTFALEGGLSLEGGEGAGQLEILRRDGPEGRFVVDAAFVNETRVLDLTLALEEAPGGIVATLAGLPGAPSVYLDVTGSGPLDDFEAGLQLATDGVERLTGTLLLGGEAGREAGGEAGATPFNAVLDGDIAPLFAPEYAEFFGPDVSLRAEGIRTADGGLTLDDFTLDARALDLDGALALAPGGVPQSFALDGEIVSDDGTPVLLPIPGEPTRVDRVRLSAGFDAARGEAWEGSFQIEGLDRPGFSAARLDLDGSGQIAGPGAAEAGSVTADFDFAAEALDLGDPAAEAALGERVTGRVELRGAPDAPLRIGRFDISGESYELQSSGTLDIADRDLAVSGQARVEATDLSVFAGLAGRPLAGAAELAVEGSGTVLGGSFDVSVEGRTQDLSVGIAELDAILAGATQLSVEARRDLEGLTVETFRLGSPEARIAAEGTLQSGATRFDLTAEIEDAALLLPGLDGPHSLSARAEETAEGWDIRGALTGAVLGASVEGRMQTAEVASFAGEARLDAQSLAPIGPLLGLPALDGAVDLSFDGSVLADLSRFDLRIAGTAEAVTTGLSPVDPLLAGPVSLTLDAARDGGPVTLREVAARTATLQLDVAGTVSDLPQTLVPLPADILAANPPPAFDGTASLSATDLAPLSQLGGLPGLAGQLRLSLDGTVRADLSRFDLRATGEEEGLRLGRPDLDPLLSGGLAFTMEAARDGGPVTLDRLSVATPDLDLAAEGTVTGLPERLVPPPAGLAEAAFEGRATVMARNLRPLGPLAGLPGLAGRLDASLDGSIAADLATLDLRVEAETAGFRTGIPAADAYVSGAPELAIDLRRENGTFAIREAQFSARGLSATAEGALRPQGGALSARIALDDLGRIVEGISGRATAEVTAERTEGAPWQVRATVRGPAETALQARGSVATSFDRVDLALEGSAPLAFANAFIAPRAVEGRARFDLRVAGQPSLSAVSGRIVTEGARLVAPTLGIVAERLDTVITLGEGRARLDAAAAIRGGGRATVSGPVTLTAPFPADLSIALDAVRLRDPSLYDTTASGTLSIAGPLAGGATIQGSVALGQTEIRIPAGVTGGTAPIPDITHVAEPSEVRRTRARAGLLDTANGTGGAGEGGEGGYRLDIRIDATNRIFIRGRGLDAELGGSIRIGGTTANVIPAGRFGLIRGRLDLLGRRLVLDEGSVTLQGGFDPFVRLVAISEAEEVTVFVVLEGPVSSPDVSFTSEPDLPEDEVVARLLFGRGIETLSPLQAAQLAASVATLTGQGGEGLLGDLRQGFGLDDLDVTTAEDGGVAVRAGRYLSENVYTDVTVSEGRTEIELNLDLTPSVTVTGRAANDGNSSIGIYYERDY